MVARRRKKTGRRPGRRRRKRRRKKVQASLTTCRPVGRCWRWRGSSSWRCEARGKRCF
jgi:hypothetical protein